MLSLCLFALPVLFLGAAEPGCGDSTINNPLGCGNNSVSAILSKIMNLVALVGGIVVVFFVIYSGFTLVMAKGNPDGLKKAKDMFFATVIGGAILLGAYVIANVIVKTVQDTVGK